MTDPLSEALGHRPVRRYPALASTEADALAWARAGAPDGAVVIADHHLASRGRTGRVWEVRPGRDLCLSVVLRPRLPEHQEGLLYLAAGLALAETIGPAATIEWPDSVWLAGARRGEVVVHAEPWSGITLWAVVTLLLVDPPAGRSPALAAALAALDAAVELPHRDLLDRYRARCTTLGRRVRVVLTPTSSTGTTLSGVATGCRDDGGLALRSDDGAPVVVLPQLAGSVEPA